MSCFIVELVCHVANVAVKLLFSVFLFFFACLVTTTCMCHLAHMREISCREANK